MILIIKTWMAWLQNSGNVILPVSLTAIKENPEMNYAFKGRENISY